MNLLKMAALLLSSIILLASCGISQNGIDCARDNSGGYFYATNTSPACQSLFAENVSASEPQYDSSENVQKICDKIIANFKRIPLHKREIILKISKQVELYKIKSCVVVAKDGPGIGFKKEIVYLYTFRNTSNQQRECTFKDNKKSIFALLKVPQYTFKAKQRLASYRVIGYVYGFSPWFMDVVTFNCK